MAADLDMDVSGAEGWGDDAELQLDDGKSILIKWHYILYYYIIRVVEIFLEWMTTHHNNSKLNWSYYDVNWLG